jgi:EAL domain-containing protein (putative c-di-GMP-specific phosphodiesterase class I)
MDGVEFIRHVAERELAGAVIIASALDAKLVQAVRSVSEGYGLRVLGAVVKPLTARALTDLLATYQRRPRSSPSPAGSASSISAADARAALARGHIVVHLQPGIDAGTGLVTCADAVPRWNNPNAGWLPPDVFRPVLERAGLVAELAELALGVSCASILACAAEGFDLEVTVLLAPESLDDTALADRAAHTARGHGTDPRRMTFALDERALRNAPASALDVLTRLRVKGFGVAIDNFGSSTGPADQLRRFPVTRARLAPMLVAGAGKDARRAEVLETVAEIARTLEVVLVGTGCESEDDLRLLLELGCDRVLGPFVAAAMPGAELPAWVAAWHPARLSVGERE